MVSDVEYFGRRAREELQAARASESLNVRLRHLEFAQAYEMRVRELNRAGVPSASPFNPNHVLADCGENLPSLLSNCDPVLEADVAR